MTTAYRESALLCPTCREPLEACAIKAATATVDLCGACGGVWIDWEDGDFTRLARAVPSTPARVTAANGPGSCPRCNRELAVEVFAGTAEVLRCGDCAGAFVPYASLGKIAAGTPADARDDGRGELAEGSLWQRAIVTLRAWMARGRRVDEAD